MKAKEGRPPGSLQRQVRPLWTAVRPTAEGLYWHHDTEYNVTQMVLIEHLAPHGLCLFRMARSPGRVVSDYSGFWLGPVTPPALRSPGTVPIALEPVCAGGWRTARGLMSKSGPPLPACSPDSRSARNHECPAPSLMDSYGCVHRPNDPSSATRRQGGAK